jgi:hypothetical protein
MERENAVDGALCGLLAAIATRSGPACHVDWLNQVLAGPPERRAFLTYYAGIGRRFGQTPPALSFGDADALRRAGIAVPETWSAADFARAALLLRMLQDASPGEVPILVHEIYRTGDNGERQAVLRSLLLLPGPERFLATAIEACRTSVQDVFDAIALDNAYPARFFPELNFNQMVLKALFTGRPLIRVVGLDARRNARLTQMAKDYASERRAAGRNVPEDIALVALAAAPLGRKQGAEP